MPPETGEALIRRLTLAVVLLAVYFTACGTDDAATDDPPKSRARIVADACHYAYSQLQQFTPSDMRMQGDENRTSYAYLVAFTADYCEGER